MTPAPETRESLLLRGRDPANGAAWEEFVSIYRPKIYRIARRKGLLLSCAVLSTLCTAQENEDRTITIFSLGTAHSVLKAAVEKIGNDQLKAVLASQIEPEGPSR